MKYLLFMDECGDHSLKNIDKHFPVFVLCGVLLKDSDYDEARAKINVIKRRYWNDKKVILHSRDIRKCDKEFKILFDMDIKRDFYTDLDDIMMNSDYTVFASAINKEKHLIKYGKLASDVYEISLSFIIERAVFFLDSMAEKNKEERIIPLQVSHSFVPAGLKTPMARLT